MCGMCIFNIIVIKLDLLCAYFYALQLAIIAEEIRDI